MTREKPAHSVRTGLAARRAAEPFEVQAVTKWLDEWVEMGKAATRELPARPSATDILAADRSRLDNR